MDKSIAKQPNYQVVYRSRPLFGRFLNWITNNTFVVGIYTIAASVLGITIDPTDPTMKFISVIGILLGVLASALGVTTKVIDLIKQLRTKRKTRRTRKRKS